MVTVTTAAVTATSAAIVMPNDPTMPALSAGKQAVLDMVVINSDVLVVELSNNLVVVVTYVHIPMSAPVLPMSRALLEPSIM